MDEKWDVVMFCDMGQAVAEWQVIEVAVDDLSRHSARPACDDNINSACPRLGGVLLSNPVARVKETGAGGANGSDSAKLLRCHNRRCDL